MYFLFKKHGTKWYHFCIKEMVRRRNECRNKALGGSCVSG